MDMWGSRDAGPGRDANNPVVFKNVFYFCSCPPHPGGVRGRVQTVIVLRKSRALGRFRPASGGNLLFMFMLTLRAAGITIRSVLGRYAYESRNAQEQPKAPWTHTSRIFLFVPAVLKVKIRIKIKSKYLRLRYILIRPSCS